jgi:hypothetical protein
MLLSARLSDGADRGNLVEAAVDAEGARGDGEFEAIEEVGG